YELIKHLSGLGYFNFLSSSPWSPEDLFRAHFILFHLLYLLRDKLLESEVATLEINSLKIKMLPYSNVSAGLSRDDNLRRYYLDIDNLLATESDDVYELLASFWNGLDRYENREQALSTLGLTDPVDDKEIKASFRKLAQLHHPDKGGSAETFRILCAAAQLLLPDR
ncbi:MAG: DnaJ domain-containing protein, partial [Gammaproteobacteria bacterium]|nr:DnaJ domain-containing protein [Gammaproteobacteria bacterium]